MSSSTSLPGRAGLILALCVAVPAVPDGQPLGGLSLEGLPGFEPTGEWVGRDRVTTVYEKQGRQLRIEKVDGMDAASANVLVETEIVTIEALYSDSFSAYPDEISRRVSCPEEFKPVLRKVVREGLLREYVLLYATARHGIGACTEDTARYRMLIGWLHCGRASELYTLSYLIPIDQEVDDRESVYLAAACASGKDE